MFVKANLFIYKKQKKALFFNAGWLSFIKKDFLWLVALILEIMSQLGDENHKSHTFNKAYKTQNISVYQFIESRLLIKTTV